MEKELVTLHATRKFLAKMNKLQSFVKDISDMN